MSPRAKRGENSVDIRVNPPGRRKEVFVDDVRASYSDMMSSQKIKENE